MQKTPDAVGWISTSDDTRETLGTQIIRSEESYARAPAPQQVGETLDEMGRTICKELETAINNARKVGIKGLIYIYIVESPMPKSIASKPIMQITFFTRRTRPTPEWNTTLYSHNDDDPYPTLEWALPGYEHSQRILKEPYKYTPKQVEWVSQHRLGTLV
jgi:hypothetical protein